MDYSQIFAFAVVALLLIMSPGPNGLLIAKTVPSTGRGAGFANIGGFLVAFYLHGTLSVLGISVLLTQSAEAFTVVKVLGALYLGWIGARSLLSAFRPDRSKTTARSTAAQAPVLAAKASTKTVLFAFVEGFLTNALNPKTSMFYLAAFPQFIPAGSDAVLNAYLLVTVHAVLNMLWFSGLVLLFARLSRASRGERFQRGLKAVTGLVFVGFGAKLLTLQSR